MSQAPPENVVQALPAATPEVGRALWAVSNMHERTLARIRDLDPALLNAPVPGSDNTIGSLLYHLAYVRLAWIYNNLQAVPFPPEVAPLFPLATWGERALVQFAEYTLDDHRQRLQVSHDHILAVYSPMSLDEYRAVHDRQGWQGPYRVSAEWVLTHVMQHEAEHRGELSVLRALLEQG